MARSRNWRYNDAEALVDVPLSVEEVEELLEFFDRSFLRDAAKVEHLLLRMLATVKAARELRANMEQEMVRRVSSMSPSPVPQMLSPTTAAMFLSPEQLEALFDKFRREQLELLRSATETQNGRAELLNRQIEQVRFLAGQFTAGQLTAGELNKKLEDLRDAER